MRVHPSDKSDQLVPYQRQQHDEEQLCTKQEVEKGHDLLLDFTIFTASGRLIRLNIYQSKLSDLSRPVYRSTITFH